MAARGAATHRHWEHDFGIVGDEERRERERWMSEEW